MSITEKVVDSDKSLLTLVFSLRKVESKYPLVALHTGSLPDKTLQALAARDIPTQRVPYLCPGPQPEEGGNDDIERAKDGGSNDHAGGGDTNDGDTWYAKDPRFRACFTKLAVFSLTAYDRVVMLDADMLVRRNMDELFDVPLDEDNRLFAATHACTCNPHHLSHYPPTWIPANCAYTTQQQQQQQQPSSLTSPLTSPPTTQTQPTTQPPTQSTAIPTLNAGLLLTHPSPLTHHTITTFLHHNPSQCTPHNLPFADQSLLSTLFQGRWVPLPYVYNALAPMRRRVEHGGHGGGGEHRRSGDGDKDGDGDGDGKGVAPLWRDGEVKAVHYILVPKPWEEGEEDEEEKKEGGAVSSAGEGGGDEDEAETRRWWREVDGERRRWEEERGGTGKRREMGGGEGDSVLKGGVKEGKGKGGTVRRRERARNARG
ncbi:nucleotide-diphospho-sugar transferase [Chaetomium tenue]|uniref:Nucleotide-diphospho-sugar transferase n=1 Tax=Chaetomium tenue TaxID=1854479 RepID=A0ACB7PJF8_9PEZI|nr:nucleotide-diphospho-sugar transferase [Chaetomium globosum]